MSFFWVVCILECLVFFTWTDSIISFFPVSVCLSFCLSQVLDGLLAQCGTVENCEQGMTFLYNEIKANSTAFPSMQYCSPMWHFTFLTLTAAELIFWYQNLHLQAWALGSHSAGLLQALGILVSLWNLKGRIKALKVLENSYRWTWVTESE